jgi:hypothetical protein
MKTTSNWKPPTKEELKKLHRLDYTQDGKEWLNWCWSDRGSQILVGVWERSRKLYPEWQFRLIIGGGL